MKSLLKFLFILVVVIAVLAVIGRIFFFEVGKTTNYSMVPNLIPGDLFLFRTVGLLGAGDVAVCRNPQDESSLVVLRIAGLPGDNIAISKNHIILNGSMIHHAHVEPIIYYDTSTEETNEYVVRQAEEKNGGNLYTISLMDTPNGQNFRKVTVPPDHFFLLGDNRNMSHDSRNFGFVPIDSCLGEAMFRLWTDESNGDLKQSKRVLSWIK